MSAILPHRQDLIIPLKSVELSIKFCRNSVILSFGYVTCCSTFFTMVTMVTMVTMATMVTMVLFAFYELKRCKLFPDIFQVCEYQMNGFNNNFNF